MTFPESSRFEKFRGELSCFFSTLSEVSFHFSVALLNCLQINIGGWCIHRKAQAVFAFDSLVGRQFVCNEIDWIDLDDFTDKFIIILTSEVGLDEIIQWEILLEEKTLALGRYGLRHHLEIWLTR